jgi:hypothetical protein
MMLGGSLNEVKAKNTASAFGQANATAKARAKADPPPSAKDDNQKASTALAVEGVPDQN